MLHTDIVIKLQDGDTYCTHHETVDVMRCFNYEKILYFIMKLTRSSNAD
jgi:hypothetical protein